MVDDFAQQDIEGIMLLMAEDAVYCDILGNGARCDEYRGKAAIRGAFVRQFEMAGLHTYVGSKIMVEGNLAFASWILVLGDAADPSSPKFEGIDEFALDSSGQVVLKKAWLRGQPRLWRSLIRHNPTAAFRYIGYVLRTFGR